MRPKHLVPVLCALALLGCASANRPLQLLAGEGQVYPEAAKQQGIEGYVVVGYDVDVEGRVVGARVVRSEPAGVFDEAALNAVRSWRFNPPLANGVKQPTLNLESTLTFKLGSAGAYDNY
jgi:TonB family protein